MSTKQAHNEINPTEVNRIQRVQMTRKVKTAVAAAAVLMMLATAAPGGAKAFGGGWDGGYSGGGSLCPNCTIYNHNETLILDVD